MKQTILSFSLLLIALTMNASSKINITRIDPTDWYVGLKDASLQLMVYGPDVRECDVTTDYPGARIDSVVRLDSPNYLLVYLNLEGAQPGEMPLHFRRLAAPSTKGVASPRKRMKVERTTVNYTLKARAMSGEEHRGFSNADVLYLLMPDRFASSASHNKRIAGLNNYVEDRSKPSLRHGGDLEGVRQHLDYLTDLGVTALWFTPVLENNSPDSKNGFSTYHGYATTDYYRVDPRFGTNEEYKLLIEDAHRKGLKVVMDMIFNHCGFEHPWVADLPSHDWLNSPEWLSEKTGNDRDPMTGFATGKQQESKYLQTSYKLTPVLDPYASQVDKRETVDGWFVPSMPDLNQRNPHVMKYLIQNSIWWIETVGIDGIRMDTYPYADRDGMASWLKTLDNEYPNFNVVGETWVTEPAYTAAWQKDSRLTDKNSYLKSVMDFSFFDKLNQAKHEETDDWWQGLNRLYNSFCYDYLYPKPSNVLAFIENHDTDRFLGDGTDTLALKQALSLLLTINRTPQLYYGTEVLMNGTKAVTDGNVRKDFPGGFVGDKHNCFTREGRTKGEQAMFSWLSRLLHWRQGNEVISRGKQIHFIPYNGIYVIARQYKGRTILTILNGTSHEVVMPVKRYAEVIGSKTWAINVITGRRVSLTDDLQLKARQSLIIEF